MSKKHPQMLMIAFLLLAETSDDESVPGAVKLHGMCAENLFAGDDLGSVQAVRLASEVMHQGL
ncbi:MAG: hypothetical protein Q8M07_28980, partial [Prosthecobacter sp.]|nr:hypothetical protein [Prosthecobacter sp.]